MLLFIRLFIIYLSYYFYFYLLSFIRSSTYIYLPLLEESVPTLHIHTCLIDCLIYREAVTKLHWHSRPHPQNKRKRSPDSADARRDNYCKQTSRRSTRPISVSVRGTEGEAVVNEGRVNHGSQFGEVEQVVEIAQMSVAASDTVASAVFVEYKYLSWTKPTLHNKHGKQHLHPVFLHPFTTTTCSCNNDMWRLNYKTAQKQC